MNVFITGINGFIGSHLVEQLLSEEHEITVVRDYLSLAALVATLRTALVARRGLRLMFDEST